MDQYLTLVRSMAALFATFEITKIPRRENYSTNALTSLASTSDPALHRVIPVGSINYPSYKLSKPVCATIDLGSSMPDDTEDFNADTQARAEDFHDDWEHNPDLRNIYGDDALVND